MSTQNPAIALSKPTSPPHKRSWLSSEVLTAFAFIIPSLIGFTIFYAVPMVRGVWISLTDWDLLRPAKFIGIENYIKLIQDPEFLNSFKVTVYYVLLNIPLQTLLALVIAVMMSRLTKSMLVRAIIILPWLMPPVVVGLLWLWLLDPTIGIVNVALQSIGLPMIPFPKLAAVCDALDRHDQHLGICWLHGVTHLCGPAVGPRVGL